MKNTQNITLFIIVIISTTSITHGEHIMDAVHNIATVLDQHITSELGEEHYNDIINRGSGPLRGVLPPTPSSLAERLERKLTFAIDTLREQLSGPESESESESEGNSEEHSHLVHAGVVTLNQNIIQGEGESPQVTLVSVDHRRLYHSTVYPEKRTLVILSQGGAAISALLDQLLSLLSSRDSVAVLPVFDVDLHDEFCYSNTSMLPPAVLLAAAVSRKLSLPESVPSEDSIIHAARETRRLISTEKEMTTIVCLCDASVYSSIEKEIGDLSRSSLVKCFPGESTQSNLCSDKHRSPTELASTVLLSIGISPRDEAVVGSPRRASVGGPVTVPVALSTPSGKVAILDMYLADLIEDLTRPGVSLAGIRAFFVTRESILIGHSSHPRPDSVSPLPRTVSVSTLEGSTFDSDVWSAALLRPSGELTVSTEDGRLSYAWKWAAETIVVFVVTDSDLTTGSISSSENEISRRGEFPRRLRYHRLDLVPPLESRTCKHFGRLSTVDRGVLYLAPSAFDSPFSRLRERESSASAVHRLMAYLKDGTGLLSNPGLVEGVRDEASFLGKLLDRLETRPDRKLNRYIIRRYAATSGGAMVSYPGSIFDSDGEPARRTWFMGAQENYGKVFYAPSRPDAGGFGRSISVSFAASRALKTPVFVLGADLTLGFFRKTLRETSPMCFEPGTRCFLMDNRGYLVYHPGLTEPKTARPVERQHVTHRESLVANDMLSHRELVMKKSCTDVIGGTVQRYYEFNLSLADAVSNTVPNDHCSKYFVAVVPGTNLFLGLVRSSCELGAFCPCSVVDRLCLNCNRMEQTECECPCECGKLLTDDCSPSLDETICPTPPERDFSYKFASEMANSVMHLSSCYDFQCDTYLQESECEGVMGCEWCRLDEDGVSNLRTPFCTMQTSCFDGVLGAMVPYVDGSVGHVIQEDLFAAYSAVGPVVGCVVALCLILAIAVYCYRQNSSNSNSNDMFTNPVMETWPDNDVRLNHLVIEEDPREEHGGHREKLLLAESPSTPISPYKIVTGYRRPNNAGESDHGYSTMTPHDDSEHLAFALIDPSLSKEGDSTMRNDSPTISTPRSSAADIHFTNLPCGKNNIVASVTVHRHMEAL